MPASFPAAYRPFRLRATHAGEALEGGGVVLRKDSRPFGRTKRTHKEDAAQIIRQYRFVLFGMRPLSALFLTRFFGWRLQGCTVPCIFQGVPGSASSGWMHAL